MMCSIGSQKFFIKADKTVKYVTAIIPSLILGLYSPEWVPGFFLKRPKLTGEIRPFGVEKVFGITLDKKIDYPKTIKDVQTIVLEAKKHKQTISVIGAGMSQGTQTVPTTPDQRVIHTKHLNHISINAANNTVTVGSGATWEQVQMALDKVNKSVIVKQASDIFSIGGSISINCHGWACDFGSISKTVQSMKVIDGNGNLRILTRPRPGVALDMLNYDEKLFKCMFGTLGYFGVIVEATLKIVDNENVIEESIIIDRDQFLEQYNYINPAFLFRARFVLDDLEKDPLRRIALVSYRKANNQIPIKHIQPEPKWGTRFQRIAVKAISHLPHFLTKRLTCKYWENENSAMKSLKTMTRNEALQPPISALKLLHQSDLHAQWLQEYFVLPENLSDFIKFLSEKLKTNNVKLVNASIRPTPKDEISILPYADQNRLAIVLCFAQTKTHSEMEKTRKWIEEINAYLTKTDGIFYQAYMPYASVEQFETCYGKKQVDLLRDLKKEFDPDHIFMNQHTAKYYS